MNKELQAINVTPDEVAVIKKTIAEDATEAELSLYLFDCARHGVHPLDKLLHFTKRGGKYAPVTSIDLMRIRAHDTGECAGIGDPLFSGAERGEDFAASCTVIRIVQGEHATFTATARWPEYYPGDGNAGIMWRKMPHTMLGKCSEALALRKAFPRSLSGLYAKEEMDQANVSVSKPAAPEAPKEHGFTDLIVGIEDHGTYQLVAFSDGTVAGTRDKALAVLAHRWQDKNVPVEAVIKPGRKPNSWQLVSLPEIPEKAVPAAPRGDFTEEPPGEF